MKFFASIFLLFSISICVAQKDQFLAGTADKYTQSEITKSTQYFRMLLPLRNNSSNITAIALKSKLSHNNKASRFRERNQLVGFYVFDFDSKQACKLAMDTLLQCFPNACLKVERDKALTGEILPSVYVINASSIYIMETFCEDYNEQWTGLVKDFVAAFATKKSSILHAQCDKLEWTSLSAFK